MVGLAQIKILTASARQSRSKLSPDESAEQGKDSAEKPYAENQEWSMYAKSNNVGLMKMPEPTMPPMTIMVASNTPSNCRGLTMSLSRLRDVSITAREKRPRISRIKP